jgi:hypothetical protein
MISEAASAWGGFLVFKATLERQAKFSQADSVHASASLKPLKIFHSGPGNWIAQTSLITIFPGEIVPMSAQKRTPKRADPVVSDQGGRLTLVDPMESRNTRREEEVRRKAYQLYEQRGKTDGHDIDDWLNAESQV